MNHLLAAIALILTTATAAIAQDASGIKTANLKDADLSLMKNHDPAVEQANFKLLPGYEVNLFASEPMLANPIHMTWDSRGRLWVACSWAYPQLKPGEKANDKIIILEDTDGDGKADKSTTFADGLYMPTGIELANGGCYVAQTPNVFFLKDTDGDDVADVKEVELTGFGIEDSHHSISAWRRGPGGWIYFQEGIFLHSQVETQHGVVRNYNGGVYQYNPRTQQLRVFAKIGVGNPWGHVFDRWGQSFLVDNPRVIYVSPSTGNSGLKVQASQLISTEKQCGGDLASGTHLGDDVRGQLLTCRFKSRAIVRYEFLENGAGFSANVLKPLIASRHPNFRPVDCKIGPDGAVYVADWYNSIINHAQHDFRDPRRDNSHGRIWRITAKGRPLVKKPDLLAASIPELLKQLSSPNAWTRHQARLVLSERDHDKVAEAVSAWVEKLNPSDPNHDHHLVEAMWALQNVERPGEDILNRVMTAKDGNARAAGARVVRYWHAQLADPVAIIAKAAGDPHPRVRMEAILSAGFVPQAEAFSAALTALDHPRDRFIDVALSQTRAALEPFWQPAMKAGTLQFAKAEHREFAERAAGIGFNSRLAAFLKNRAPAASEIADIKARLVSGATAQQVRMVTDALTKKRRSTSREMTVELLDALQQIGRRGDLAMQARIAPLQRQLGNRDDAIAAGAAANLGTWKVKSAGPALVALIRDDNRAEEVRRAAAVALGDLGPGIFVQELRELATGGDLKTRTIAVHGLAVVKLDEAAAAAATLLEADPENVNPVTLVRALLQRNRGADFLTKAMKGSTPHPKVVASVARFHRQTGLLPPNLAKRFESPSNASLNAALLKESREDLVADVDRLGDPVRGEMVYRRKSLACTSCHGIGPVGPSIGPNLVAVGAAAKTQYIVEAILEPNKSIAEHFENVMIVTDDGKARNGVITYKSEKEIVIRASGEDGKEVRIAVGEIEFTDPLPSLMPTKLADQLQSRQEFLDLARFVSLLGRPGPYANDESPVIRKWRIAAAAGATPGDKADDSWLTGYSMVNGELPVSDLDLGDLVYARGFVNVQIAGSVKLKLNDSNGLRIWIDQKEVLDPSAPLQFARGRRTLTFAIDRARRGKTGLRVELVPVAKSPAKFTPEGGK